MAHELDIPEELKVANRKPAPAKTQPKPAAVAKPVVKSPVVVKPVATKPTAAAAKPTATAKPTPAVKSLREGKVTAIDLAKEFKIESRELRGLLRSSSFKKGEGGWCWNAAEANKVREWLKAELKKVG